MGRTIEQAARDAMDGSDETLWQTICERYGEQEHSILYEGDFSEVLPVAITMIMDMTPAERSLYDISEEA